MNRNHYMMLGMALLLLGITIFKVDNVTLTEGATKFLAQQMAPEEPGTQILTAAASPKKTIPIPPAIRFACISVGAILILHAAAMQKPG